MSSQNVDLHMHRIGRLLCLSINLHTVLEGSAGEEMNVDISFKDL